jgi:hypothetical protein
MKRIILTSALFLFTIIANSQNVFDSGKKQVKLESTPEKIKVATPAKSEKKDDIVDATIDFESKVVDYGVIDHNSDGNREFVFTNNGTEPLIIKNAKGSCGCTVPTYPREPIAPGVTEKIKVKYATSRVGKFTKTITLTTNSSKKPVILTIKGEVNPAPKEKNSAPVKKSEGAPLEK